MTDDSIATRLGVAREALETAQCFARLLESTTDIERRRYLVGRIRETLGVAQSIAAGVGSEAEGWR